MNENVNNTNDRRGDNGLTKKLLTLAILMGVAWIATQFVWGVIQDREDRQREVSAQISEQWSRPQTIAGPVLTIPVEKTSITPTGERGVSTVILTLLPQNLSYDSQVAAKLLTRGVYDTPVYTTTVSGAGNFDLSNINKEVGADSRILWDKAVVSINVSDPRGISSMFDLVLNENKYQLLPASNFSIINNSGVHAEVKIDPGQTSYPFSFDFPLKGSREISFLPLGENTDVTINSDWNTPSFIGEFLPEERSINENGFSATWKITSYGKNLPQSWIGNSATINPDVLLSKTFGVGLYQEVDFYTMVDRSTKYSILFISLTFLTFFMYEILAGLRIHPVQYLLVGLAIALFYLLLLSFAEIIGFVAAYVTAALATTLLITGYCFSVLKLKKRALSILALLTALYGYLYILLQLDQYSLLFGSVLLFGVLAIVMYITRNLDWYSVGGR
ncbi:MAG: cell envelope integrity protein CreD [Candidatus Paceibacterota bacterium]